MRRMRAFVLAVLAVAACSRGVQPDPALDMVAIPPGTFVMGANDGRDDEQPAHPVTLTQLTAAGADPSGCRAPPAAEGDAADEGDAAE